MKERNRRAIIEAAGELATARGMGAFTVAELADRAGTSRRSIFNHFPSADDAVYAYLTSCIDPLIARLGSLPQSFSSIDGLVLRIEEIVRGDDAYEILHHVGSVLSTDPRRPGTVLWASQLIDQVSGQLGDVIRRQLPNHDPIDVRLVSHALISAIQTSQTIWFQSGPTDHTREEWTDLLLRSLELVRIGCRSLDR